ncbi:MAG: hypothetical protein AAF439_08065 [Pseudomonadota bacterium]
MNNVLSHWFNDKSPVGFIETPDDLVKKQHKKSFRSFFDSENFLSQTAITDAPSAILGRRGSGKTAILYHLKHQGPYPITVEMETFSMFDEVASNIDKKITEKSTTHGSFVENYAKIWSILLHTSVICSTYDHVKKDPRFADDDAIRAMEAFLRNSGLLKVRRAHSVLRAIVRASEKCAKTLYNIEDEFDFLSDFIDSYFLDEIGYSAAKDALEDILGRAEIRALILMDSLEQFPVNRIDMIHSLGGLLHFAGKLKRALMPIDLCFAFAAELHEDLKNASSNDEKDFNAVLTLHWDVEEVLHICAHRFEVYREIHDGIWQEGFDALPESVSRNDLWAYWHQFLPSRMKNRLGIEEDSIAYISRHTQLLPRHYINILNEILSTAIQSGKKVFPVDAATVVAGVRAVEDNICEGILSGYEQKYPEAETTCRHLFPHLPNVFNRTFLQRAIRDYGRGEVPDVDSTINMLIRIGAIGAVEEITELYVESRFDYTYNGQMPYNTDSQFSLHPAFAGKFRGESWAPKDREMAKPVYPIETFVGRRPGTGRLL